MQYRGQVCLSEADPTATQDKSGLSVTSKEAESDPQNAYGHMKSKPLANTVSNHHPYFQISSLYKHFFFKFPILLNSMYQTAELTRDIYLHDNYLQKISQAI